MMRALAVRQTLNFRHEIRLIRRNDVLRTVFGEHGGFGAGACRGNGHRARPVGELDSRQTHAALGGSDDYSPNIGADNLDDADTFIADEGGQGRGWRYAPARKIASARLSPIASIRNRRLPGPRIAHFELLQSKLLRSAVLMNANDFAHRGAPGDTMDTIIDENDAGGFCG